MEKEKSTLVNLLSWSAITDNILFMLWISYNGINEHFKGTIYQKMSYVGLMGLLAINIFLILRKGKTK
jgi:hypothetical protein